MEEQIVIEGMIEHIVYQNESNGYTVFSIIPNSTEDDKLKEITCTACIPKINEGENIRLLGNYVIHPTYGRQFNVESYEKKLPSSVDGIAKYLASGIIKGVGIKIAQRIVDKFGKDTLFILEKSPEKLSQVKGITRKKALLIGEVFKEQSDLRYVMIFLHKFDISPILAQKIFKRYKENTIYVIKANPYMLADDISGIGFKTADSIAAKIGMDQDSIFRIKAGIKYVLNSEVGNGHVYLPMNVLCDDVSNLLGVSLEQVEHGIAELKLDRIIYQESYQDVQAIYLNMYYYMEVYVAKKLTELAMNKLNQKTEDINRRLKQLEAESGVFLADEQKVAVLEALSKGVLVITGGPGTGKTTTINTIIKLLKEDDYKIELAAPTGRAAKRMTEATGMEAKTIHRLLGSNFSDDNENKQRFEKNEDSPLETDIVIIDESSMVDINLMFHLLKAIPHGKRLILVGDVDQLPSVGAGNVLKDIILSGKISVVRLTEIFRQAQESAIVMNAHRINNGKYPVFNEEGKDFFIVKRAVLDSVISTIIELITVRLPNFSDYDPIKDIQVLTPMRRSALGVSELNQVLQQALNPPTLLRAEKEMRTITYREGDKVMQTKNNYGMVWRTYNENGEQQNEGSGIFNGDEGVITLIDEVSETITVKFDDDKVVRYDYSQLEELELSYAITIHKSQGSEYKVVVIPIHSGPPMLMNRNLLYTAVTRAKELAVIVGIPETLYRMVDNNREVNRYTSLCHRIKTYAQSQEIDF